MDALHGSHGVGKTIESIRPLTITYEIRLTIEQEIDADDRKWFEGSRSKRDVEREVLRAVRTLGDRRDCEVMETTFSEERTV